MKRLYFQRMVLSGTLILALGACAHKPTKTMRADIPMEVASPPPQHRVLLQEARSESDNLRGEMARLKILMAKQMGELQALRKQSQSIQHREQGQGQELQNIRSQLLSSQVERDQLRKHNMELEGQVASLPDTSQLVSDIQTLTGSFQQIMSSMKNLSSDMRLIKQEMHITTNKLKPQQTKMATSPSASAMTAEQTPDVKGRILIQDGDTLWRLSRTYRVSVDQLREWNHLSSDLIMTGLRLKVSEPPETLEGKPEHVKTSNEPSTPMTKEENPDSMVQTITHPAAESPIEASSETTHILSIARPQTDANESP